MFKEGQQVRVKALGPVKGDERTKVGKVGEVVALYENMPFDVEVVFNKGKRNEYLDIFSSAEGEIEVVGEGA